MATLSGKLKPFVTLSGNVELYNRTVYPVGGTQPPVPNAGPAVPGDGTTGPLPGTNCINILQLRDYYKIPYPPVTALASPPVIAIVSFGGGVYGQPVSSGKYAGFWRCTDISGAGGAPIQILVSPMNGAINAPNADDGGATLENTVDIATVNAFYGMINQGRDAPVYTPPVIILYIAPSDDMNEIYNTFYTVLNNPVICNGQSYLPNVVCCSWGAPEVAWTQKNPFPPPGEEYNNDPNADGIMELNRINDLLADATKRGINICVSSGDIELPQGEESLATPTIMFPASSPYVTCVGGSSVFFPNGPTRNWNNPGEFAWSRAVGGLSTAFPLPDYQSQQPGPTLISANAFLESSNNTSSLVEVALGAADVGADVSGNLTNVSLVAATKAQMLSSTLKALADAQAALAAANAAASGDAASLQLQLVVNNAQTAVAVATANNVAAQAALAAAQDAVMKTAAFSVLLNEAAAATDLAVAQNAEDPSGNAAITVAKNAARDAAMFLLNNAASMAAASVFSPKLNTLADTGNSLNEDSVSLAAAAQLLVSDLNTTYNPFNQHPVADYNYLSELYGSGRYSTNMTSLVLGVGSVIADIVSANADASGVIAASRDAASPSALVTVVALAARTGHFSTLFKNAINDASDALAKWNLALAASNDASGAHYALMNNIPAPTAAAAAASLASYTAANAALTDATLALANADYNLVNAGSKLGPEAKSLYDAVTGAPYRAFFDASGSALVALLKSQRDASGASLDASGAMFKAGCFAINSMMGVARVAQRDAAEATLRRADWVTAAAALTSARALPGSPANVKAAAVAAAEQAVVAAADATHAAVKRAVASANAAKILLNSANIDAAVSSWAPGVGVTAFNDVSGCVVSANAVLTAVKAALTTGSQSDASVPPVLTSFTNLNTALTTLLNDTSGAVVGVANVSANASALSASMAASTLAAEVSVINAAVQNDASGGVAITSVATDYAAIYLAADLMFDEFKALNAAADEALLKAIDATFAADLASKRVALATSAYGTAAMATTIQNKAMDNAQAATIVAVSSALALNKLVQSYAAITPSLVDAANRSVNTNLVAAQSSNLATAVGSPAPITPQTVQQLQSLVLAAKAAAKLNLESDPTNAAYLQTVLNSWDVAVSAGAAVVDALDETAANGDLSGKLSYFNGTVASAFNATDDNASIIAVTSDAYLAAQAAANFSTRYFSSGRNGANLLYLMNVANGAIVQAWHAAEATNVASSNADRVLAVTAWNTAATNISTLISRGFADVSGGIVLGSGSPSPNAVKASVLAAYTKVTGLLENGTLDEEVSRSSGDASGNFNVTNADYLAAVDAWRKFKLAFEHYNVNFTLQLEINADVANTNKHLAQVSTALALVAAKRTQMAVKNLLQNISALATSTGSYADKAALDASEAAYAAADNVNMYRCIPDIAMHANADDLPVIYRLNGANVYVGGTSVAAAMFAGFLAVVQAHSPINYFLNPVLYKNFSFPSPLLYDISGTNELVNPTLVQSRTEWLVAEAFSDIHGSYNTRVGLGSIRGDGLSSFLEVPQLVTKMVPGPYPLEQGFDYNPVTPAPYSVDVYPGTTKEIFVFVLPGNSAYNTNVTWASSSPYNVTVSQTLQSYESVQVGYDNQENPVFADVYRATVTGVVPLDSLASTPVITISSTDGSNVFATVNVNVKPSVQVTGISISAVGEVTNPSNTVLFLGDTKQLVATVTPLNATNKNVYWWSSNPSIVTVDVNGLLTPLSTGQVTIRATTQNNNISASISVYVPTPMTGVSVSPSHVSLNPNLNIYPLKNTQLLKATVTPANVDYKYLKWTLLSSIPLPLPPGTTDQLGNPILYKNYGTPSNLPAVVSIPTPDGIVLKRDSNGNIIDNTQDMVTSLSNGTALIQVSTDGVSDNVYGTYSAMVSVNVTTPITDVKMEQTNMVINLNPQTASKAVNPSVNIQYAAADPNMTAPALNATFDDRNLEQAYKVTATLFPAYPSNMNLIWSSSNPRVAIVSNNTPPVLNVTGSDPSFGLFQVSEMITPLSNGSTVIKVTTADGAKVATVNVTVTTPVTGVMLSPMPVTLNPGKQYALQATVLPITASTSELVWSSTNSAVATVDQNGVVTAVASGSCGISVKTIDGAYSAMATINVVTPLVGVSLVLNTPTPIHIGDVVQILVVMTPTTASDQAFTWNVTNGLNGNIFTNGPAQNGNIVYLDAAQAGTALFTVTTHDGNKQASLSLAVVPY